MGMQRESDAKRGGKHRERETGRVGGGKGEEDDQGRKFLTAITGDKYIEAFQYHSAKRR